MAMDFWPKPRKRGKTHMGVHEIMRVVAASGETFDLVVASGQGVRCAGWATNLPADVDQNQGMSE